jgi:hypothetical protein
MPRLKSTVQWESVVIQMKKWTTKLIQLKCFTAVPHINNYDSATTIVRRFRTI